MRWSNRKEDGPHIAVGDGKGKMGAKHESLMYNFRGVYGYTLTPAVAWRAGFHVGRHFHEMSGGERPRVLVGSDHRFSGGVVKHFVIQGLLEAGCRAIDAGLVPTPIVSWGASRLADGGCAVTASHNPPEYNGLKFFDNLGAVLQPDVEAAVLERAVAEGRLEPAPRQVRTDRYECIAAAEVMSRYAADLANRVQLAGPLRVAVDCRLGMAGLAVKDVLTRLGCTVEALNDLPHPYFLDGAGRYVDPEPTPKNLQALGQTVKEGGFDLGLAFDGDCDRVVVVDETGSPLLDDVTLLLLARALGDAGQTRVITMDTSLMVEKWLRERGHAVRVTPVGDPYVAQGIAASNASFGGVPNGHYLFPGFNGYSDGFCAAAMLARIASEAKAQGGSLSALISELPPTHILKTKRPFGRSQGQFVRHVAPALRRLFKRTCGEIDYMQTDDAVVACSSETKKTLVRYNRWDHRLNVQAESLVSAQEAQSNLDEMVRALDATAARSA
jgi:phosphomannomutase/phosphoglucomutase